MSRTRIWREPCSWRSMLPMRRRRFCRSSSARTRVSLASPSPGAGSDSSPCSSRRRARDRYCSTAARCGSPTPPEADVLGGVSKPTRKPAHGAQRLHHRKGVQRFTPAQKLDSSHARFEHQRARFRRLEVPAENLVGERIRVSAYGVRGLDSERVVIVRLSARAKAAALDDWPCRMCANAAVSDAHRHLRARAGPASPTCSASSMPACTTRNMVPRVRSCPHHPKGFASACILFCAEAATQQALIAIRSWAHGYINDYPPDGGCRRPKLYDSAQDL